MSNFNKWNRDENFDSDKLNVVLFVSRNKNILRISLKDETLSLLLVTLKMSSINSKPSFKLVKLANFQECMYP